jgi:hypothetical protein
MMLNSANPQPRQQTPLSENLPPQQTPGLFSVSLDQGRWDHLVAPFLRFLEKGHDAQRSHYPDYDHRGIYRVRRNAAWYSR